MKLRAGDWVEVLSKEEILRTLDKNGRLEELPFMPQMFQYCGQRYKVFKRAHKTCDTVNQTGGRKLSNGIHLDLRCDGDAYGGCQAACLIFWKESWLKPVDKHKSTAESLSKLESKQIDDVVMKSCCTEAEVFSGTRAAAQQDVTEIRYVCQATHLPYYTTLLPWWDVRQYLEDYSSGNISLRKMFNGFAYAGFFMLWRRLSRILWGLGARVIRIYDKFQAIRSGLPFPRKEGTIPAGKATPSCYLNLQPGELVRVKSYDDILATLDTNNKNRGLYFDAELVPFCGGTYRVRTCLNTFIDEKTGEMVNLKSAAYILEDVYCQARYSDCRLFCPRSIYSWWRDAWLERVPDNVT